MELWAIIMVSIIGFPLLVWVGYIIRAVISEARSNGIGKIIDGWEYIGNDGVTGMVGNVPKWISKEMGKCDLHRAVDRGEYFVICGKYFEYKIVPAGQGGNSPVYVYRRKM